MGETRDRTEVPRPRTSVIPPQHGAWAFVGLPAVLGTLVAPTSWWTALVIWAAFTLYPVSYFAGSLARARRGARFRRPLLLWSLAAAVPVLTLIVARPWLLWAGLGYAGLFVVNLAFARRNHERDLANDAVLILQVVALVPLIPLVAAPGAVLPGRVWLLTAVTVLVLLGSTLHVKSLLRERGNPAYARASRRFSVVALVLAAGIGYRWGLPGGLGLVVPFVLLAGRAFKRDWSDWRPGRVGLVELCCFVAVATGASIAVSI